MPIPVRVATVPDQGTLSPPVPVDWSRTSVSVVGSNGQGEEIFLTGFTGPGWPAVIMQQGATGLDMPPFALFSDESPSLDGAIYRSARASAREVMIPVYLHGVDRRTVNQLKRRLFQALNPKKGPCILRFSEGDGSTRELWCYYKGGMEGSESTDTAGFTWAKYALQFTAMDPWFYRDAEVTIRWNFGLGEPFLSSTAPFFPMRLVDGVMGGDGQGLAIYNPGDVEAWPVWALRGPIKSFDLTGPDGSAIKANPPSDGSDLVATGRTLTIDTRPGKKTVRDNRGVNYWASLAAAPQFWSVEAGESNADITVVTGSGRSSVTLTFAPRYASYV